MYNNELELNQIEAFTSDWIESYIIVPRSPFKIKTVVHVVYSTDAENISDDQIQSQIDVLNQDFQALNLDFKHESLYHFNKGNAQIQFELADKTPEGAFSTGINRRQTEIINIGELTGQEGKMLIKHTDLGGIDAWQEDLYLNIWIGKRASSYGEATRPGTAPDGEDGVIIDPYYFGSIGTVIESAPYDLGRICTHEIGHYFNLIHLWGNDMSCASDDMVDDTPNQAYPHFDCLEESITCEEKEMVHNFMDYVQDDCMYFFTKGQVQRMWACLQGPRVKLIEGQADLPDSVLPDTNAPYQAFYNEAIKEIHIYNNQDTNPVRIHLYSMNGQLVYREETEFYNFIKIDANGMQSGGYVLCLQTDAFRWTQKILVY